MLLQAQPLKPAKAYERLPCVVLGQVVAQFVSSCGVITEDLCIRSLRVETVAHGECTGHAFCMLQSCVLPSFSSCWEEAVVAVALAEVLVLMPRGWTYQPALADSVLASPDPSVSLIRLAPVWLMSLSNCSPRCRVMFAVASMMCLVGP